MRAFLRQNSLSLFFGAIFLMALVGQAFAGQHAYNAHRQNTVALRSPG